jgi:hypothetical protein
VKAGIRTLHDEGEMREACDLVIKRGEKDPLRQWGPRIRRVGLKAFFDLYDSRSAGPDQVLDKLEAELKP